MSADELRTTEEQMKQAQVNLRAKIDPFLAPSVADFYDKLAARLGTDPVVPAGFLMCVLLLVEDLRSGKDGYDGSPMTGKAVGLPPVAYTVMLRSTPHLARMAFPNTPFAEACVREFLAASA
jgi:hypothetical protein